MERKDGFLVIDDYKELPSDDCISRGVYASCWLENKDVFLFKHYGTILSCYRELFYSRLATKIGIPNVGYDLAIYHGRIGVITKRCTRNESLSMKNLLMDYLEVNFKNCEEEEKEKLYYRLLNIDTLLSLLKNRYKENSSFVFSDVYQNLLIKFISSILFANPDLNAKNLDFDENTCQFLPLYDFGSCGRSIDYNDFNDEENYFALKLFYTKDIEEHPKVTLEKFLECADAWKLELFYEYLERACTCSMDDLQEEIESDLGIFLPSGAQSLKKDIVKHLYETEKHCRK